MALIRPFVPAHDFAKSCDFYLALGFEQQFRDEDIAIFDFEGAGILLQNFYVKEWADNQMVQFFVHDLDTWWTRVAGVVERFGIRAPTAPAMQPWGIRVGFLVDPSGVLWHVAEPPAA